MSDRLLKKLQREFNAENPIYNYNRVEKISKQLKLPSWWVQLVIVEYLPCRKFVRDGKAVVFDFGIFDKSLIPSINKYRVVIPSGCHLFQNVRIVDFSFRTAKMLAGEYIEPFSKESDVIPEGLVSSNASIQMGNAIQTTDPKSYFNWYAIIQENDRFYQWKIAELYNKEERFSWFKSNLFDLLPLWDLTRQIDKCGDDIRNKTDSERKLRQRIVKLYDSLERLREPIRKKILEYHNEKKATVDPSKIVDEAPPLLTFIDTLKTSKNKFEIESHLEPIFYLASIENCKRAEVARDAQKDYSSYHEALLEEIKNAALCIICTVTTLESYVNYVIGKYLPSEVDIFDRASIRQKWLHVPPALNLPFRFSPASPPFKIFSDVISWRNGAIHHKPEFTKAVVHKTKSFKGYVGQAYKTFNLENAKLAIKCEKAMIQKLSEGGKIPEPRWLKLADYTFKKSY